MRLLAETVRELYTLEYISNVEFRDWLNILTQNDFYDLDDEMEIYLLTEIDEVCQIYEWPSIDVVYPGRDTSGLDWCIPIGGPVLIGVLETNDGGALYVVPESMIREYPILLTHFEYAYDWCL